MKDKLTKILNRKSATKQQLREALAELLGVEVPFFAQEAPTVFSRCRQFFMEKYQLDTEVDYSWSAKDAGCLSQIIKKLYGISKNTDDESVINSFEYLIIHLPSWYADNGYSLCVINGKFNEIIKAIKNNEKQRNGISIDYKAKIIRDLQ